MANKLVTFFLDHRGEIGRAIVYLATAIVAPNDAVVQAIRTAFLGLSKAVITGDSITVPEVNPSSVAAVDTGDHSNIDDRIVLKYVDASSQYHLVEIPAPKDELFEDSAVSNDLKSDAFAGTEPLGVLVALIADNCQSEEGDALTFVEGWYDRRQAD